MPGRSGEVFKPDSLVRSIFVEGMEPIQNAERTVEVNDPDRDGWPIDAVIREANCFILKGGGW